MKPAFATTVSPFPSARALVYFSDAQQLKNFVKHNNSTSKTGYHLHAVLPNLQAAVLSIEGVGESKFLSDLRQMPGVVAVEKEIFYKSSKTQKLFNPTTLKNTSTLNRTVTDFLPAFSTAEKNIINIKKFIFDQPHLKVEDPWLTAIAGSWNLRAIHVSGAWRLGAEGQGVRVLVLDTGVDQDHPALRFNFEKGKDFIGDQQKPYDFYDSVGHGTHVAGIIAGYSDKYGFIGVAPKVKILAGRVMNADGGTNIDLAKGIDWGLSEKVDVINISLSVGVSTNLESTAISRALNQGISLVAGAGNDGSARVSYPAALPEVIAVGAIDQNQQRAAYSQYGPELSLVAPGEEIFSSVPRSSVGESKVEITIAGQTAKISSASIFKSREEVEEVLHDVVDAGQGRGVDFLKIKARDKWVLIAESDLSLVDQLKNAIQAEAAGVLFYANSPGLVRGGLGQDFLGKKSRPAVMIEQSMGLKLKEILSEGVPVQASVTILNSDYAFLDGTSMATPHVSGVVALLKSINKCLLPVQIKNILQDTASLSSTGARNEVGYGLVNAEAAVKLVQTKPPCEKNPGSL
ncbi:MAG: S8 family serine peptidase [Pseudobdellovibrionaceae bacterium]